VKLLQVTPGDAGEVGHWRLPLASARELEVDDGAVNFVVMYHRVVHLGVAAS